MDIQKFLSSNRSMVCAPAGYGKTYTIAQCVAANTSGLPLLILTHTNAGVHSIRKKIKDTKADNSMFELSTICGFEEWLVSYYVKNKTVIPTQSDDSYYQTIQDLAIKVAKTNVVQKVLSLRFSHILIDEFQDCSCNQLQFIEVIGRQIPVHVLGDHLQSIYGFKDIMVDMNGEECQCYAENIQTLETPWRWNNVGNANLGQELHSIRESLMSNECIDLRRMRHVKFCCYPKKDKYVPRSDYSKTLWHVANYHNDSVILLAPVDEQYYYRVKLVQRYNFLNVLESVDDNDFYEYALAIDKLTSLNAFQHICGIALKCMQKDPIKQYVKDDGNIKNVRKAELQDTARSFRQRKHTLETNFSQAEILATFEFLENLPEMRIYRRSIMKDLKSAIKKAIQNHSSVYEAMRDLHNRRKRMGWPVLSKYVGTSLLTKGLEFDHVIILDAHKFTDARKFYVAITRGCKSVTIISEKPTIVCGGDYSLAWQ